MNSCPPLDSGVGRRERVEMCRSGWRYVGLGLFWHIIKNGGPKIDVLKMIKIYFYIFIRNKKTFNPINEKLDLITFLILEFWEMCFLILNF